MASTGDLGSESSMDRTYYDGGVRQVYNCLRKGHSSDHRADRCVIDPRHRRCRIPRTQCATRCGSARLYRGAEARRHRADQARAVTTLSRRACHRPFERRPSLGPQSPRRPTRRCRQRHHGSRRLQLPTHPGLDRSPFARLSHCSAQHQKRQSFSLRPPEQRSSHATCAHLYVV